MNSPVHHLQVFASGHSQIFHKADSETNNIFNQLRHITEIKTCQMDVAVSVCTMVFVMNQLGRHP